MGRIQTNIGLITGMPIGDTVEKLMKLATKPRDLLVERTDELQTEQAAVTELSGLLLAVKYVTDNLGKEDLYDRREVTSSEPTVLAATMTGQPNLGTYVYTPLRTVRNQQLLSSGFESDTDPIGAGRLTFRFGDDVQRFAPLERFGGAGVDRGKIRVTDRSGASAVIDLTTVQTVEDVLEAINGELSINVTAVASGDRIRLIDHTGQSVSNLKVQEIGSGTTATSLGLEGIDVAAEVADGHDMLWLREELELDLLNDGNGVLRSTVLPDIQYQLRDGTTGTIDLSPIVSGSSEVLEEVTLGDVLEVINAADPEKLRVEIAPDGDRLVVSDLTTGGNTFALSPLHESRALRDLGLDVGSAEGVITGRRILGGAATVLLSSLGGGDGLGQLGSLELTDRSGAADQVDLSAAETLDDVVDAINAAEVGIVARVNQARNGIELLDTTGAWASHLIVASGDETATAEKLGVAVDADVDAVNGGDLHLQVVSHNTRLDGLNGGAGVARGAFEIRDSTGISTKIDLRNEDIRTVGDVIDEINRRAVHVFAEINPTGDGIRLVDTGGGGQTLVVAEGTRTTAKDLHLLRSAESLEIEGKTAQVIDGSMTYVVELGAEDSLEDLQQTINELGAGVSASTLVDGSSKPFRLALASQRAGKAGQLVVDTSELGFALGETVRAQDALLVFGEVEGASGGVLVSSSSNRFKNVLPGVKLEIKQASEEPVTISVTQSDTDLIASLETMVENYNKLRERLDELTRYDAATDTRSALTGDATALRLANDLGRLLSGRIAGAGSIQSLAAIGVELESDGTLRFDKDKFLSRLAADRDEVQQFLSTEQFGVSGRFDALIEQIAGEQASLLGYRIDTLTRKIEQNEQRIEAMDVRLDAQRERLYMQFYRMELAIGKLQANLTAVDSIQALPPLTLQNTRY